MPVLRPYQRASLDALTDSWKRGGRNGLIVLPTGAGKALVIAALVRETLARHPDHRVVFVTHTRELIDQNHSELLAYWPDAPAGLYSAGLGRREAGAQILFCGIQSGSRTAAASRISGVSTTLRPDAGQGARSPLAPQGTWLSGRKKSPALRLSPMRCARSIIVPATAGSKTA
ncbi:DEAD/DEAH box helicase [Methylobacterium planeticum]|uniref:DEAD/DEAH box helicase n=1 Tax=Methylobacterium planeticum TaxID=2615211 RepID=UPI0017818C7E